MAIEPKESWTGKAGQPLYAQIDKEAKIELLDYLLQVAGEDKGNSMWRALLVEMRARLKERAAV